ncbi:hypothetical protein HMPREF1146_1836 [Prevotella sp. MSX73]|uniref:Uncharacterized protein n=1 Tax=Segatella buccae ATCC 33574 TaxID=873513 RepID=E6K438_9BACT|nr:hypothetical protein HMPREF6485_0444 [Segatella buccae ATCC 33574]EJP31715.1 hypothetical protein HMPREF1146_1836 [Prevotella sp. MSX73]
MSLFFFLDLHFAPFCCIFAQAKEARVCFLFSFLQPITAPKTRKWRTFRAE